MRGVMVLLLAVLGLAVSSQALAKIFLEKADLPWSLKEVIAEGTYSTPDEVYPLKGGTFSWSGGYISAVSFRNPLDGCKIFVSRGDAIGTLFSHAPCTLLGRPKLAFDRNINIPDIIYKADIFAPQNGVMVNVLVAFYYDGDKGVYCESSSLGSWYLWRRKGLPPVISDARCPFR